MVGRFSSKDWGVESPALTPHYRLWDPAAITLSDEVSPLGVYSLVLAQAAAADSGPLGGILDMLRHTGLIARLVLLTLVVFSLGSWAIIIYKGLALRRARSHSDTFLEIFRKSNKFSDVNSVCVQLKASPLVGVFQAGYAEVNQQVRGGQNQAAAAPSARPTVRSLDSLSRSLARAATVEVTRLERRISFLATTASVTPFIGLFGTVWGIMTAFGDIGRMGSANLAVVAPGIAEALVTTAAGLAAAIPAAVFYNLYNSSIRQLTALIDDFAMEFLNIVERNFT
jgi:biopolymer transport protein TolQ